MKFLIPTEPEDTQAIVVKLALDSLGHQVDLVFTADFPTRQKNAIYIEPAGYHWQGSTEQETFSGHEYDIVWWRRARKPFVPKERIHADDYQFVLRENQLFYESWSHNLAPNAWWVNRKEAANRANFKLFQLKIANDCGLKIPVTLCSNDPHEIRTFVAHHEVAGVIYKPLCAHAWFESAMIKTVYTSRICMKDLPADSVLQQTPGIFQKEIHKKYELRITAFGDYLVASKLDSQCHPEGQIDWRAIAAGQMRIEPYLLPVKLAKKIRAFMRKMGLVFGSFDFIVTPEGDYIFLEVNEQGQFLWIEEYNPDFPMLDIFIHFLLNQSRHFRYRHNPIHRIEQYSRAIEALLTKNKAHHVETNLATTCPRKVI